MVNDCCLFNASVNISHLLYSYNYIILSTIAGDDYVALDEILLFDSGGEDHQVFSVDIINDEIVEDNESFEVVLKVTDDDPDVLIVRPTAVGTITDDDDA